MAAGRYRGSLGSCSQGGRTLASGSPCPTFIRYPGPLLFPVHPFIGWDPGGAPPALAPQGRGRGIRVGPQGKMPRSTTKTGCWAALPPVFDFQLCSSPLKGGIYLHAKSEHGTVQVPHKHSEEGACKAWCPSDGANRRGLHGCEAEDLDLGLLGPPSECTISLCPLLAGPVRLRVLLVLSYQLFNSVLTSG